MSKQLKLKFKKLLKKADFIHADLEYHEELVVEAKHLFAANLNEWISRLPKEEQQKLTDILASRHEAGHRGTQGNDGDDESATDISQCTDLTRLDKELQEDEEEDENTGKVRELKKMFRRIAAETHPDKAAARGTSEPEAKRLEKLFRSALDAYNGGNWYTLYSIATDLGLDFGAPSDEYLEWIEEDIRLALGAIAQIAHLVVWAWYTGDAVTKDAAMRSYFQQTYNYDYPM
tara:strand:- start:2794 stop:3489 length:696 start_codon:yes stop_codon:yes gene_type:complete